MSPLKNKFVDTCVVVGINEDVDFVTAPNSSFEDSCYRYGPYRQYLLSVFNEDVAYFPQSRSKIDCSPYYDPSQVVCHATESEKESYDISQLPFEMDIIGNLPTFCFPSGGYVYCEMMEPEITYLVLTDLDGIRTYAICITCCQSIPALKSLDEENNTIILKNPRKSSSGYTGDEKPMEVYTPICICLVSSFPFFNTMKDCLSSLLAQINMDGGILKDWKTIMKLATTLTLVPVPPAGPLAISFSLFDSPHTIYPPSEADRRVVDIDIHLPLLIFSPELIVGIVTCLLTQQRMIFMSSSYSLLTIIIESFFTYIDPIKYIHTYIPTLPNSLWELIEAPGQFIMGVHSSLKPQVKHIRKQAETPNIVLVDIDKGEIDLGAECNLPAMPDIVAQSLIVRLKKIKPHFDLRMVSMPTMFSYKDISNQRRDLVAKVRSEIRDAFLDMLVSLFGSMFNFMSVGKQHFDKEAFSQSHIEDERDFFEQVVFTDAFRRFVDERLEKHEIRDDFAVLGEKVAEKTRSCDRSITTIVRRGRYSTLSTKVQKHTIFTIPKIPEEGLVSCNYYQLYCNKLSHKLKTVDQKSIRLKASYIYLRGFAHIACGNPIEGLRDFHALYSLAPELFPKELTTKLINDLDPKVFEQLQSESFYKETVTFGAFIMKHEMENSNVVLQDTPVDKDEFDKRWKPLKAAISSESRDWLFGLLSSGDVVIPYQRFSEFYRFYEGIDKGTLEDETGGIKLQTTTDRVLKVSSLISTEKGMGRLVLTVNKLYFMRDGAREEILITPLCDIKEVISYQKSSVLFWSGVESLQIINSDKHISPFYACLKEERNAWVMFLNELSAGHKSSITLKEQSMVDIAVTNVMVAQALLLMKYRLDQVEDAFSLIKNKVIETGSLSDDTKEAFEIRLDPCIHDKNRTTVCSIAYVPGNTALNETPSVWIGLGSGTIVVYETEKWNCISELRYAKSRISKLFLVGANQIWAGSIDTVIYVINTETRNSEQQLQSHTDFVSDIISHEEIGPNGSRKLLVWSSSYNGQIICWDPEAKEPVRTTTLKNVRTLAQIVLIKNTILWCVTNDEIIVVDTANNWTVLQRLMIFDDKKFPILLGCALKVSEESLWIGSKFGSSAVSALHIWDTTSRTSQPAKLDGEVQICSMLKAYGSIWVGNKDGRIIVLSTDGRTVEREFHVHEDKVQSMCETLEGHVVSGSSSREGKVCVWNAMSEFDVIDGKKKLSNKRTLAEIKENYEVVPLISDMPSDAHASDHFK